MPSSAVHVTKVSPSMLTSGSYCSPALHSKFPSRSPLPTSPCCHWSRCYCCYHKGSLINYVETILNFDLISKADLTSLLNWLSVFQISLLFLTRFVLSFLTKKTDLILVASCKNLIKSPWILVFSSTSPSFWFRRNSWMVPRLLVNISQNAEQLFSASVSYTKKQHGKTFFPFFCNTSISNFFDAF